MSIKTKTTKMSPTQGADGCKNKILETRAALLFTGSVELLKRPYEILNSNANPDELVKGHVIVILLMARPSSLDYGIETGRQIP